MNYCALFAAITFLGPLSAAQAPCPSWDDQFFRTGALEARSLFVSDDGNGAVLHVGGGFTTAGDTAAVQGLATWTPSGFQGVGYGLPGAPIYVRELVTLDVGTSSVLVVAGQFAPDTGGPTEGVSTWDGTSWTLLGGLANSFLYDVIVFDAGSGPSIYATGEFTTIGGIVANRIARWNGSTWEPLGLGLNSYGHELEVFDPGSGPQLIVAGAFTSADGNAASRIAAWTGTNWVPLGTGVNNNVSALFTDHDGGIQRLYVGGRFVTAGGVSAARIACWNGTTWSPVGAGITGGSSDSVFDITEHDDGTGPTLYATGSFWTASGSPLNYIRRWDGSQWSTVGGGLSGQGVSLASFDAGDGRALYCVGDFRVLNGTYVGEIARFRAGQWEPLPPIGKMSFGGIFALEQHDDGSGPALYAGGQSTIPESPQNSPVSRWNGESWSAVGTSLGPSVFALKSFYTRGGPRLYAGGSNTFLHGIGEWNGTSWSVVGGGVDGSVQGMAIFNQGGDAQLYVIGSFNNAGGVYSPRVARWDGTSWYALGQGIPHQVYAICEHTDSDGSRIYLAGDFPGPAGFTAENVVAWDGSQWSAVGPGIVAPNSRVNALASFEGQLYAGGVFATPARNFTRWDGRSWNDVDGGVNGSVQGMIVFDDGGGPALYVMGTFSQAGTTAVNNLARWDGASWSDVGGGLSPFNDAMAVFDGGGAKHADLYLGGSRSVPGEVPSSGISAWRGCAGTGSTLCAGDGSASPCPCANNAALGSRTGCRHAFGIGARLKATGVASLSADSVQLIAEQAPSRSPVAFFQALGAANGGNGVPFGDGLQCLDGPTIKLAQRFSYEGETTTPAQGEPRLSVAGLVQQPGTRVYQVLYRNPPPFCTTATFNSTNAVSIDWKP